MNEPMPRGVQGTLRIEQMDAHEAALRSLARMKALEAKLKAAGKLERFTIQGCVCNATAGMAERIKKYFSVERQKIFY